MHVDRTVPLIAQKARCLLFLIEHEVDAKLDNLLDYKVSNQSHLSPSKLNPLVIVPKKSSNGIRVCDFRVANTAIICEHYQIPTLEEMLLIFIGYMIISKLDRNKRYHQIAINSCSRDATALATHREILSIHV